MPNKICSSLFTSQINNTILPLFNTSQVSYQLYYLLISGSIYYPNWMTVISLIDL